MSDIETLRAVLTDAFGRVTELVEDITANLSPELATYRPDPDANSIAWLVWHVARLQDDHIAGLAGTDQVWPAWRDRFGLPFDDWAVGYGQSSDEVGQVKAGGELLRGYYTDANRRVLDYIGGLTTEELERVVDTNWDPPVTAAVRLVSVLDDNTQHMGQAAYVRGLAERAGIS